MRQAFIGLALFLAIPSTVAVYLINTDPRTKFARATRVEQIRAACPEQADSFVLDCAVQTPVADCEYRLIELAGRVCTGAEK